MSLEQLKEFTKPYLALMPRVEMQRHGDDFLEGLLADLERKSVEPIAERLGQDRRPLQYFIGESPWEHEGILDKLSQEVAHDLGEPDGVSGAAQDSPLYAVHRSPAWRGRASAILP